MQIVFNKLKEHSSLNDISLLKKPLILVGDPIDQRSRETINYLREKYNLINTIIYQNQTNSFLFNGNNLKKIQLKKLIQSILAEQKINHIILESTSLGYPEILTLLKIIVELNKYYKITMLYIEPEKYKSNKTDIHQGSYELSEDYLPHKYIKPFTLKEPHDSTSNEPAMLISFIGFEENRLGRILTKNNDDYKYDEFIYIIAIPGFKYGWENISLAKHYHLIDNNKEIYYTPADDPYDTYKILEKITENYENKKIVIMPLGTKPCTIGTSIFLVNQKMKTDHNHGEKQQIATKFDFPEKAKNRTSGISIIYEYQLEIK